MKNESPSPILATNQKGKGSVGLKIDPSESDGVGAVPGDLPDSGSGKTDLGRQKRSCWCWCWCQLGHPRIVEGRRL